MSCILSTVEEHDSRADSVPLPPPIPDLRFAFPSSARSSQSSASRSTSCSLSVHTVPAHAEPHGSRSHHRVRPVHLDHVFRPFGRWFLAAVRAGRWLHHPLSESYSSPSVTSCTLESVCPSLSPLAFLATGTGSLKGNITASSVLSVPKVRARRRLQPLLLGRQPCSFSIRVWSGAVSRAGFRAAFPLCFAVMALVIPFGILFRDSFRDTAPSPNLRNTTPRSRTHHHHPDPASRRDAVLLCVSTRPASLTLFAKTTRRPHCSESLSRHPCIRASIPR